MRIIPTHPTEVHEGDLTPMIDMTFQLIAFFMVLVNFTQTEHVEGVQLPQSTLAKPPDEPLEYPIILNVTQNGHVIYAGNDLPTLKRLEPYLVAEADRLRLREMDVTDATIIIRAHRLAETGKVQRLIQTCQEKQFVNFALRALEDVGNAPNDPE